MPQWLGSADLILCKVGVWVHMAKHPYVLPCVMALAWIL